MFKELSPVIGTGWRNQIPETMERLEYNLFGEMGMMNIRTQIHAKELVAGIWASFWLLLLTMGEPDLLEVVIGFIRAQSL